MPKEGLTNKQQAFCFEYTIDHNAKEAAERAGYSKNGAKVIGCNLLTHINCKAEIDRLEAEKQAETEHNYQIAITELNQVIDNLAKQAKAGHVGANRALIAAIAEKDSITGLHKQTIQHKGEVTPERSEAERQALAKAAHDFKLRLAGNRPDKQDTNGQAQTA